MRLFLCLSGVSLGQSCQKRGEGMFGKKDEKWGWSYRRIVCRMEGSNLQRTMILRNFFKNTFFTEYLWTTASECLILIRSDKIMLLI